MLNKNILDEYNTVKSNVGLFDFSIEGKIKIKGEGRVDFINGLVSNDVKNLKESNGVYAAFLDKLGKILSDCIVYKFKDFLLLNMNLIGKNNVIKKLKDEAPLGKSELDDLTLKYALFSLQGPKSVSLLNDILNGSLNLKNQYECTIKNIAIEMIIAKNKRTTEDGYDIFVPSSAYEEFKNLILEKGKKYNAKAISNDTYNILRLEAGIPLYGIDFTEKNILPEITEKAVSYEKGCYIGQEIVARIKNLARGATAKKLVRLEIGKNDVKKNDAIMINNKKAGYITSAAFSPNLRKVVAFGFLYRGFYENILDVKIDTMHTK